MHQDKTPLADALQAVCDAVYIPFDVPGHKNNVSELTDYFGRQCLHLDKNSRLDIDYLCHPTGVIKEAQELAAAAFGAKHAFFMIGGTTSSVQAMIMCACAPGDKILLPRNVHSSAINAVILSGANPVYIEPAVHPKLGISLGTRIEDVERCIKENPDAKAIFINNPTYYGICSDIKKITQLAHEKDMKVLVDEAHGTHFYFNDMLPTAAMHCGADMAAVSMHKTGGSLTQSALLLSNGSIGFDTVNTIINLTRSTSASYLLMASLDIARRTLALQGKQITNRLIKNAQSVRQQINMLNGLYAFGKEIIDGDAVADFDITKLAVMTAEIGLTGIEVYTLLRDRYKVQIEFGDMRNILALCTLGDKPSDYDILISALKDISRVYAKTGVSCPAYEYIAPTIVVSPRTAFYARKKSVHISSCANSISGEAVMIYPPGIPLLAPGELVTQEIINHITFASEKGCTISGMSKDGFLNIICESVSHPCM